MKKLVLTFLAASVAFLSAGLSASAQGKYGADSAECIKYLSYYQEYYKQKNYESALPNWRRAYALCPPSASQNMFVHGTTLMTQQYNKVKDVTWKAGIVDTILALQDQRMTAYPKNRSTILNNKGQYMINYKGDDAAYLYKNLNEIMEELGAGTKRDILVKVLQASISLYRENQLQADEVIGMYDKVSELIEKAEAKKG